MQAVDLSFILFMCLVTSGQTQTFCSRQVPDPHSHIYWKYNHDSKRPIDIYKLNETLNYSCRWGYTKIAESATCKVDGWNPKQLCVVQPVDTSCPTPAIENGFVMEQGRDMAGFYCNAGFKLDPPVLMSLCIGDVWSLIPECIGLKSCTAPAAADHVTYPPHKETYPHGEIIQFECDAGYTSESQQIQCENGEWETPFCLRDYNLCTVPPLVENGKIIPLDQKIYTEGLKVKYTCERFYQFKDTDTVTCRLGQWTESPECIPRETCDKPEGTHVTLVPDQNEYSNGNTVRYFCNYPFTAKPGKDIRCEGGRWTDEVDCTLSLDYCAPLQAGSLKEVVGESQAYYPHGARVEFQCPQHYKFDDGTTTQMMLCLYGRWAYNSPCKKPCKLNPQDMIDRNIRLRKPNFSIEYISHRDSLTFDCQGDTRMKSRSLRTTCYDGTVYLPECR